MVNGWDTSVLPKGGNLGETLCKDQLAGCREPLKRELTLYTPSRLILFTGPGGGCPFLCNFARTPQEVAGFRSAEECGELSIAPGKQQIQPRCCVSPRYTLRVTIHIPADDASPLPLNRRGLVKSSATLTD